MLIARWIVGLLLVAGIVCFAVYLPTAQQRYRSLGILLVKWTVIGGLGFFAVLILERVSMMI